MNYLITRPIKTFFILAYLMLSQVALAKTSTYNSTQEIPKYTSVSYVYGEKATVITEKDLIGRFDYVKIEELNSDGSIKDFVFKSSPNGKSKINLTIKSDSGTNYRITFYNSKAILSPKVFGENVWEQDIFVPPSLPENAEKLAKKHMPIVIFNDQEEYFPQSLEEILSYSLPKKNNSINIRNGKKEIHSLAMGQTIMDYLKYNGNNKSLLDFEIENNLCELEKKVGEYNINNNQATAGCYIKPILASQTPTFLRFSTGDLSKSTVYWDAVEANDKVYLSYYFFYPFDPKSSPSTSPDTGAHPMDRESFTIVLSKGKNNKYAPEQVVYAGHIDDQDLKFKYNDKTVVEWSGGKTSIDWENAQKIDNHPVIYKAQGAHAIYPLAGKYSVDLITKGIEYLPDAIGEIAGSNANKKMQNGKFILPNDTNIDLVRMDLNKLNFLSFSGYWVDGLKDSKFPPFIRAPISAWLDRTNEATSPQSNISDFDWCLTKDNPSYETENCKVVRERFKHIQGINNYRALPMKFSNRITGEILANTSISLKHGNNIVSTGNTDEDGKHTFFFPAEVGMYGIDVTAHDGRSINCANISKYAKEVSLQENNPSVVECDVDFINAKIQVLPQEGIVNQPIRFVLENITNISSSIKSVVWNFFDTLGSSIKGITASITQAISKTFNSAGEYQVNAELKNANNETVKVIQKSFTVKDTAFVSPSIQASASTTFVGNPVTVRLEGGTLNAVTKLVWQYGTVKATVQKQNISSNIEQITPKKAGDLKVTATLYGAKGNVLAKLTKVIKAFEKPLLPLSYKLPATATTGQAYDLSITQATGDKTCYKTYSLDWGDGIKSNATASKCFDLAKLPKHTYTKAGAYTLNIKLTTNTGKVVTKTQKVTVKAAPKIVWKTNPANGNQYTALDCGTWTQCQAKAVELGGNLVTIRNAKENQWLVDNFDKTKNYWIGFTDKDKEGVWKWISGEPVTYENWHPGEPNNYQNVEDYAHINCNGCQPTSPFVLGQWNDAYKLEDVFSNAETKWGIIEKTSNTGGYTKDKDALYFESFNNGKVGNGMAHGLDFVTSTTGKAAKFTHKKESRIQYDYAKGFPRQGTIEFVVNVNEGYHYRNYKLNRDQNCALVFTTDIQGGDTTWPGSTWIYLCKNGDISFHIAGEKYEPGWNIKYRLLAKSTDFKFNNWHRVGFSFGSEGRFIYLDGKLVAADKNLTDSIDAGGNHSSPKDYPTVGESVSSFWSNNQYEGGFNGLVDYLRISDKQQSWHLSK